jgi:hypothetical protein
MVADGVLWKELIILVSFFCLAFQGREDNEGHGFFFLCSTNCFIFLKSLKKIIPSNLSPPTFYVCMCVCKPIYKGFFFP